MIKITFSDGITKTYKVGCRDLLCTSWDNVDYEWAFAQLSSLLNIQDKIIESWRAV